MRTAAILFVLILFAATAQAQGAGSSTTPRREDPLQRKLQSVVQLEMIEAALTRRPAAATDRSAVLAQVREDFWRIQLANDQISETLSKPDAIDRRVTGRVAAEVRTRAKRLKENLALPDPKTAATDQNVAAEDLRPSLARLSGLIDAFVSNPMLSQKHVVDATLSLQASRDLESIIVLSGRIKRKVSEARP